MTTVKDDKRIRSIELDEVYEEGERRIRVTYFVGGMDVAVEKYRTDSYSTLRSALTSIENWWVRRDR